MLGGGDLFFVAAQDDRTQSHALAEDLRADDEAGEYQQDPDKLSEKESPRDAEAVEAARHARDEAAERDEERGRYARVQLATREGHGGARQGSDEVDGHSDRPVELCDDWRKRPAAEYALLRHEDVRAEDRSNHEREGADDVERPREDPDVAWYRAADRDAGGGVERVRRVERGAQDERRRNDGAEPQHRQDERRDERPRAPRRDRDRHRSGKAHQKDRAKRGRVLRVPPADREG